MAWTPEARIERPTRRFDLAGLVAHIERFQRRRPDTDPARAFNHQMVDVLDSLRPLRGRTLLDVGASYCGYSLERALALGAAGVTGLSLEINRVTEVRAPGGFGRLLPMDAERLAFADDTFDLALSLSTFEHLHDPARVLSELHRVLRPGGSALLSFEPVWTCSYGHHLHHLPQIAALLPPWAHLRHTSDELRARLAPRWPTSAPLSLDAALRWTYSGTALNRVPGPALRRLVEESAFAVCWIVPLEDADPAARAQAEDAARELPWTAEELLTRGYSALLDKP
jgi:SAM-dependent methyltransferase